MPIYEYTCESGHCFERRQGFHDQPLNECPECRSKARRVINTTAVIFKGSGWYVNDYGGRNGHNKTSDAATPSSEKSEKTEKPPASDSAPAPKAKGKSEAAPAPASKGSSASS
ncbi:MAG: zinc ribbon domain-containing protein [Chloroflexi bacterium]|nr:zinc ribbon domain-containing protein [Chloroflexota bacterium]